MKGWSMRDSDTGMTLFERLMAVLAGIDPQLHGRLRTEITRLHTSGSCQLARLLAMYSVASGEDMDRAMLAIDGLPDSLLLLLAGAVADALERQETGRLSEHAAREPERGLVVCALSAPCGRGCATCDQRRASEQAARAGELASAPPVA